MMKRLLELRVPIYDVLLDDTITKPRDRGSLDMKDSTWTLYEIFFPILEPLAEAAELLTKEDQPKAGTVYVLIKILLQDLAKDLKKTIASSLVVKRVCL